MGKHPIEPAFAFSLRDVKRPAVRGPPALPASRRIAGAVPSCATRRPPPRLPEPFSPSGRTRKEREPPVRPLLSGRRGGFTRTFAGGVARPPLFFGELRAHVCPRRLATPTRNRNLPCSLTLRTSRRALPPQTRFLLMIPLLCAGGRLPLVCGRQTLPYAPPRADDFPARGQCRSSTTKPTAALFRRVRSNLRFFPRAGLLRARLPQSQSARAILAEVIGREWVASPAACRAAGPVQRAPEGAIRGAGRGAGASAKIWPEMNSPRA